jgi:hypothetical protein
MLNGISTESEPVGEVFPALYLIRVNGCLDGTGWDDWFSPMQILCSPEQGMTVMLGPVVDQAELYGLLSKLRNLALPPLLVERMEFGST